MDPVTAPATRFRRRCEQPLYQHGNPPDESSRSYFRTKIASEKAAIEAATRSRGRSRPARNSQPVVTALL